MDILRFITAGNVDDGKSTLIGRLLYDTKNIKDDVLESVNNNLAYITDGLRSERQQGITIDVAYKYFTTQNRKYIITDAPGHFQYTRNLVTGASGVDAIIILIDAHNGITEQTKRHSLVASFLKIKHVVVAINKMDAVSYDEQVFTNIKNEYVGIAQKLGITDAIFIPISALKGYNVSFPIENMAWYNGPTLMQYLESCRPALPNTTIARFSVQCVIDNGKRKSFAGKLLSGSLKIGDPVDIYPGIRFAKIQQILKGYEQSTEANAGENICLCFEDVTLASRGDLICKTHSPKPPQYDTNLTVTICWLDAEKPLVLDKEYLLRINTTEVSCTITEIIYKTDVSTYAQNRTDKTVNENEFARVSIITKDKIACDPFAVLPETGRGIIIDITTNYTSGAFVVESDW
jgi:sulfate adenylyltransferase subunit 1